MKYIFWLVVIALAFVFISGMIGQYQQIALTQAEALNTQAGAIDTLAEAIKIEAESNALALRSQARQLEMQSMFFLLAGVAIIAEVFVLLGAFILFLVDRRKSKQNQVLVQQPQQKALPRPGEYLVMWPSPHYEAIEQRNHEL